MRKWKQKVSKFLVATLVLSMVTGMNGPAAEAKKKKENVKVTSVKITNADKKLRLQKGKTFRLKTEVKVKPNKSKYKKVKFTSADRRIAMVNSQGLLKGKKVGTTKITAVSRENKAKKATITVSVTNDILVKKIKLNKSKIKVDEFNEDDIQLKVTKISPKNAKNKDINWSTSNEKVADVDDDGVVTTGDAGTAVITASADDNGGAKATCTVVVTPNEDNDDDEDDTEPSEAPSVPDEVPVVVPPAVPDPVGPTEVSPEPPTATPTATSTATPTATPKVTPTATPKATPTATPKATPTVTPTSIPTAAPTAIPTDKSYYFTDICSTETNDVGTVCSDPNVAVRAVKDENDKACTELRYTKTNQYVIFELPEGVDMSKYKMIRVSANVPSQLSLRVFSEDLDMTTKDWWVEYCLCVDYPFYEGTDGEEQEETIKVNTTNSTPAKYIALISSTVPDNGYERENYLIYSITLVPKSSSAGEIVLRSTEDTTEKPTDPSEIPIEPAPPIETDTVIMSQDNETVWAKDGNYGSQTYDSANGSVSFSTEPKNEEKPGNVYNNGAGWYLSSTKGSVDLSEYQYVEVILNGECEWWNVKMMTWSGGSNPDTFWDKADFWGMWLELPTQNADGTVTMRFAVDDIFKHPQHANAIGFTLKACEDDNDQIYMAKDMTVYSIRFTKATEEPTPDIETPSIIETPSMENTVYNFTDICVVETNAADICSDHNVAVRAVKDENDQACTEIRYTKTNQCIFFELPEAVDLSEYQSIRIQANVPEQLAFRVLSEDIDTSVEQWWSVYGLCESYPFYGGTDGEVQETTLNVTAMDSKPAKYIELVSNKAPANGYDRENYLIYSITLIPKSSDVNAIVIKSTEDTTEKPTDTSETPIAPAPAIETDTVIMSQDNETVWAKDGNYGSQTYDSANGSVSFSTEPKNEEKPGNVYNNGVGWYLSSTKTPVDLSEYQYVEVILNGECEWWNVKMMTWSGGQNADTFWDKNDTWSDKCACPPIYNEDGTTTVRYAIADAFTNPQRANAVGITLKACEGSDDNTYVANDVTIYSIRFTK